jgi:hypothetical protein
MRSPRRAWASFGGSDGGVRLRGEIWGALRVGAWAASASLGSSGVGIWLGCGVFGGIDNGEAEGAAAGADRAALESGTVDVGGRVG